MVPAPPFVLEQYDVKPGMTETRWSVPEEPRPQPIAFRQLEIASARRLLLSNPKEVRYHRQKKRKADRPAWRQ